MPRKLKSLANLGTPEARCLSCDDFSPVPWVNSTCPKCGEQHPIMRDLINLLRKDRNAAR